MICRFPFNLTAKGLVCVFSIALSEPVFSQAKPDPQAAVANSPAQTQPAPVTPIPADPAAIDRWRAARFGMFIHWGPVSQTGREISWSRGTSTPIDTYDALYKTFDPEKFNADDWVAAAKAAGMKYIVLTCKHHDGFCLWDTKQTDYNIMHTPFKRDIVAELSQACKKQGIAFGAYYSTCDWHNPDFPRTSPGGRTRRPTSNINKYTDYLKAQVSELLTNYGPLWTLWFDVPEEFDKNRGQSVINLARTLQPDIVINNRTGAPGDYLTPEQKIGGFNMDRPWESCMTVSSHNAWAWGGAKDGVKSKEACISMLVNVAGGDGNMLLNVGPRPDGLIDPAQVSRLKDIGGWLLVNGDSIYGTRGGPYLPTPNYVSTRKDDCVYIHVLKWTPEADGKSGLVTLPPLKEKILASSLLAGDDKSVSYKSGPTDFQFEVRTSQEQPIDTVIKLTLDSPAIKIPTIPPSPAK